jgi:serine phosphatase RsbU (regulator of sigma subunit)/anti-sigma regulatory factor (Ser/Thr protein kinase)
LRNALTSQGAAADVVEAIRLGVTEALTNAVRHGKCPPGEPEIRLRWSWPDAWLTVDVVEPGFFEAPANWTELPADPLCEGGRGGFLIAEHFDELQHLNSLGRHTLRMRKNLGLPRFPATVAAELDKTLSAMTEDLSASYETLSALFRLAEALATTEDLGEFIAHAMRLRTLIDADAMHVRLRNPEDQLVLLGSDGPKSTTPTSLPAGGEELEARVFRSGLESTFDQRTPFASGDPLRNVQGVGFICPVYFQSRQLGVCVLVRHRPDSYFTAAQLSLARTTAEFLGIACANAEFQAQRLAQLRAQRELEIAAQIQQSLVPSQFPQRRDWAVYGVCVNALEAGGDFFDVMEVDGGVLIVIADVMGKGVPAALLAVVLRTAVRAHTAFATTPGELLNRVSAQIAPDLGRLGMFITAQVIYLKGRSADLCYANAGHCPIAIVGATGAKDRILDDGGLPLGVAETEKYATHEGRITGDERLLLTTDGIVESPDLNNAELGLSGLMTLARRAADESLPSACVQVIAELKQRDQGRPAADDRTLVLVQLAS